MLPASVSARLDANNRSLMALALATSLRAEDHFSPPLCEEHGAEWGETAGYPVPRRRSHCAPGWIRGQKIPPCSNWV